MFFNEMPEAMNNHARNLEASQYGEMFRHTVKVVIQADGKVCIFFSQTIRNFTILTFSSDLE